MPEPTQTANALANQPLEAEDFGTSGVASAADAIADTSHWFVDFFDRLFANLTWENVFAQICVVVLAFVLGNILSKRFRILAERWRPGPEQKGIVVNLKHLGIGLLENVAFGFIAGSVIALSAYIMVAVADYPPNSLVVCRIFYNLFYAYSFLSIVTCFLQATIGKHIITPSLRKSVSTIFWCLAVLQFFGVLGELVNILDATKIPIGKGDMTLWKLLIAAFSVLLTLGVANWLSSIVAQFIDGAESLSANQKVVLTRVFSVLLMVLAVIIGLGTVGIDLTILSVFGGALGVGLGFGLQKIASNYISGFIILLDKSIKIGDLVQVGAFRGKVTEINTRFTVVRSADGIENIVPNETFVTTAVQNLSYTDGAVIQYVDISVAYGANVERALQIMLEEASKERPRIVKGRKGWAYVDSYADSGINLKLGFWLADPVNGSSSIKTEIGLAVYRRFQEENIEIPYNRLEIVLRDALVPIRVEEMAGKKSPASADQKY